MTEKTLNILQITDTHIFADKTERLAFVDTRSSFLAVRELALESGIRFDSILLTGDLSAKSESAAFLWLTDQFAEFAAPISCLPGNHDVAVKMMPLVTEAGWQFCASEMFSSWQVVSLNSARPGAEYGNLGSTELARLDQILTARPSVHTLLSLHHHPVPMMSKWMDTMTLRDAAAFWTIVDRHPQVRCVLWGHVHQNYDSFRNGVRLLATPSTCVQFAARSPEFAMTSLAPGFRVIKLSPDGDILTEVVRCGSLAPREKFALLTR